MSLPDQTQSSGNFVFDPGGTFLIVGGYSLLRLLPKPRGYGSMVAKEFISEVAHQVLDKMPEPIESTRAEIRNEMTPIRVVLFDLFELQLVFDPGITDKEVDIVISLPDKLIDRLWEKARTTYLDFAGALLCVNSPGCHRSFSDGDELLCFYPAGIICKEFWYLGCDFHTLENAHESHLFCKDPIYVPDLWQACLCCVDVNQAITDAYKSDQTCLSLVGDVTELDVDISLVKSEKCQILSVLIYNVKEDLLDFIRCSNSCCDVIVFDPGGGAMIGNHEIYLLVENRGSFYAYMCKIALPFSLFLNGASSRVLGSDCKIQIMGRMFCVQPFAQFRISTELQEAWVLYGFDSERLEISWGVDKKLSILSVIFPTKPGGYHVLKRFKIISQLNSGNKQLIIHTL